MKSIDDIDSFENHDWFVIKTEDGEIYIFTIYENAKRLADWYLTEFSQTVEFLAGWDGQSVK